MTRYSSVQLDALTEVANIGSGHAATALSSMIGRSVELRVPRARALSVADAVEAVGPLETEVTAVLLGITGAFDALMLLVVVPESATRLCSLLGVEAASEVGRSALGEIGNILGSAYLSAIALMSSLELAPTPPETISDYLGAVLSSVTVASAGGSDAVLMLDSELSVEGVEPEISLPFLLIPKTGGITPLLHALGVE
jgi:chemotaxis protein CheC